MGGKNQGNGVAGLFYIGSIFFFVLSIALGAAFIFTSASRNFFKWKIESCNTVGQVLDGSLLVNYDLDMTADIGWRQFTVTYLDMGAVAAGCFSVEEGETYSISEYQDNNGSAAGFSMMVSWILAVLLAIVTTVVMGMALIYGRARITLTTLSKWCILFSLGLVAATTTFWWLIEGKFGNRDEALAPRLLELVAEAAAKCTADPDVVAPCFNSEWKMETPGSSLSVGITAMCAYLMAAYLLWMRAPRVDAILAGADDMEPEPVTKHVQGVDFAPEKKQGEADDKARGKDRRSARTGGRAPTSTVGGSDTGPDPMTYALQEGGDEELGSQEDPEEEEVVYQNHHVHPSVVNHSKPNATQVHVDDTMSRQSEAMSRASPAVIGTVNRQRAYSRGYSRGTSGQSHTTGGNSFDAPSEADAYSETGSSAFYHQGHNQGSQSFASVGSRDSFDDYSHQER